jgi:hypothetical protein
MQRVLQAGESRPAASGFRFPPSERKYGFNLRFWQVGMKTGLTV